MLNSSMVRASAVCFAILVAVLFGLATSPVRAQQPYSTPEQAFSDAIGSYTTPEEIVGNAVAKGWKASPADSGGIVLQGRYGPNGDYAFIRIDPADYYIRPSQPQPGTPSYEFKKWESHLHMDTAAASDPGLQARSGGIMDYRNASTQAYDTEYRPTTDRAASHIPVDGDPRLIDPDKPPPPPASPAGTGGKIVSGGEGKGYLDNAKPLPPDLPSGMQTKPPFQQQPNECGVNCLANLLRDRGQSNITPQDLAQELMDLRKANGAVNPDAKKMTLNELDALLRKRGIESNFHGVGNGDPHASGVGREPTIGQTLENAKANGRFPVMVRVVDSRGVPHIVEVVGTYTEDGKTIAVINGSAKRAPNGGQYGMDVNDLQRHATDVVEPLRPGDSAEKPLKPGNAAANEPVEGLPPEDRTTKSGSGQPDASEPQKPPANDPEQAGKGRSQPGPATPTDDAKSGGAQPDDGTSPGSSTTKEGNIPDLPTEDGKSPSTTTEEAKTPSTPADDGTGPRSPTAEEPTGRAPDEKMAALDPRTRGGAGAQPAPDPPPLTPGQRARQGAIEGVAIGTATELAICFAEQLPVQDCVERAARQLPAAAICGAASQVDGYLGVMCAAGNLAATCIAQGLPPAVCMKQAAPGMAPMAFCMGAGLFNPAFVAICGAIAPSTWQMAVEAWKTGKAVAEEQEAERRRREAIERNESDNERFLRNLNAMDRRLRVFEDRAGRAVEACLGLQSSVAQFERSVQGRPVPPCGPTAVNTASANLRFTFDAANQIRRQVADVREGERQLAAERGAMMGEINGWRQSYARSPLQIGLVVGYENRLLFKTCPESEVNSLLSRVDQAAAQAVATQNQVMACRGADTPLKGSQIAALQTPQVPNEACNVYVLDLSGPSVWVGTESERLRRKACSYLWGSDNCSVMAKMIKQVSSHRSCSEATASWCAAFAGSPVRSGYWFTRYNVYGDWVTLQVAPSCPETKHPEASIAAAPATPVPPPAPAAALMSAAATPPPAPPLPSATTAPSLPSRDQPATAPPTPPASQALKTPAGAAAIPAPVHGLRDNPPESEAGKPRQLTDPKPAAPGQASVSPDIGPPHASVPIPQSPTSVPPPLAPLPRQPLPPADIGPRRAGSQPANSQQAGPPRTSVPQDVAEPAAQREARQAQPPALGTELKRPSPPAARLPTGTEAPAPREPARSEPAAPFSERKPLPPTPVGPRETPLLERTAPQRVAPQQATPAQPGVPQQAGGPPVQAGPPQRQALPPIALAPQPAAPGVPTGPTPTVQQAPPARESPSTPSAPALGQRPESPAGSTQASPAQGLQSPTPPVANRQGVQPPAAPAPGVNPQTAQPVPSGPQSPPPPVARPQIAQSPPAAHQPLQGAPQGQTQPRVATVTPPAPAAPPPPPPASIAGAWAINGGGIAHVIQNGNNVSVTYRGGRGHEQLQGVVNGTFDGRNFVGTYRNQEAQTQGYGTVRLTLSPNGRRLEGAYTMQAPVAGMTGPMVLVRQ